MAQSNDLSRCLAALDQDSTLVAVIEMSLKSWLVTALVPGVARQPMKKLEPDGEAVLRWLYRLGEEAVRSGRRIERITLAFESGRDGFWLARFLRARGIETYVIHSASVPVSREHRRAKTDRLDAELLLRAFLGWLRGEAKHCQMVAIPTLEEEDGRRPGRVRDALVRERTRIVNRIKSTLIRLGIRIFRPKLRKAAEALEALRLPEGGPLPPHTLAELRGELARFDLVRRQIAAIEAERLARLTAEAAPRQAASNAMVRLLARVLGMGVETADMLVGEILSRGLRDRRAVARYAGLTGAPDESGSQRREQGLARAGNARVRRGMLQFAWRFLRFQKDSPLAQWYAERVGSTPRGDLRKKMVVALARKLLIALWRMAATGVVPQGIVLRPAA
jgi:transposase